MSKYNLVMPGKVVLGCLGIALCMMGSCGYVGLHFLAKAW